MTTSAIAKVLEHNLLDLELHRTEKRKIVPHHLESPRTDEILDGALDEARELVRQCGGLKELMPANAELYESQFQDALRKIAEGIQQKLEFTP